MAVRVKGNACHWDVEPYMLLPCYVLHALQNEGKLKS